MRDLDRALADIGTIRSQIAARTVFLGFGPLTVAATGALAGLMALAQVLWLPAPPEPLAYFAGWTVAALLAGGLVLADMHTRSRRLHSGLADEMIRHAVARFLPAVAAGALVGAVLGLAAPAALGLLPGLWQVFVGIGIFAALPTLPRAVGLAGLWYLGAGLAVLALGAADGALHPWRMGLPFAVGQVLIALLLHRAARPGDGRG